MQLDLPVSYDIHEIKVRLAIPQAWTQLALPGESAPSCRSPFRPDKSPSFSVYDNGRRWKDHSTGDGGDVIDFICTALCVEKREGIQRAAEMAGLLPTSGDGLQRAGLIHRPRKPTGITLREMLVQREKEQQRWKWPSLRNLSDAEIQSICRLRHVRPLAVETLAGRGRMWATNYRGDECYAFKYGTFLQLRRLDGEDWIIKGEKIKTQNPLGCEGSWVEAGSGFGCPSHPVLISEGPISVLEMQEALMRADDITGRVHRCTLIAAVSAARNCSPELLRLLAGRRVKIIADNDSNESGSQGAARWEGALAAAGCTVNSFKPPDGFKDLGNLLKAVPPEDSLWTQIFTF